MKRATNNAKTQRSYSSFNDSDKYQTINVKENFVESMEDLQKRNEDNSDRIKNLLDKLTMENDGEKLANYEPIENPQNTVTRTDSEESMMQPEDLMPKEEYKAYAQNMMQAPNNAEFSYNDGNLGNLANYNDTYTTNRSPVETRAPYYAKMGIGATSSPDQKKLLEKINYMIHLLELQQSEKTANVTEEFILYTFLGIFIIFIVDKFSSNGKYVR